MTKSEAASAAKAAIAATGSSGMAMLLRSMLRKLELAVPPSGAVMDWVWLVKPARAGAILRSCKIRQLQLKERKGFKKAGEKEWYEIQSTE